MLFLAGSVFFVGGILSSLGKGREPSWLLFTPYLVDLNGASFIEIAFLAIGLFPIVAGIASGLHFYLGIDWYLNELGKANDQETLRREHRIQTVQSMPKILTTSKRKKLSK